jgi:hypothetical protein
MSIDRNVHGGLAVARQLCGVTARPPQGSSVATSVRWFLAACSFGAAVLHFGYSPSHFGEYWLYGLFFVVVAWLQLLWAVGVVLVRWRWLLLSGIALNAAVRVVWLLSRTVGV